MKRTCALVWVVVALLAACGKYGPPQRARSQAAPSAAAELEVDAPPSETGEDQENDQ